MLVILKCTSFYVDVSYRVTVNMIHTEKRTQFENVDIEKVDIENVDSKMTTRENVDTLECRHAKMSKVGKCRKFEIVDSKILNTQ